MILITTTTMANTKQVKKTVAEVSWRIVYILPLLLFQPVSFPAVWPPPWPCAYQNAYSTLPIHTARSPLHHHLVTSGQKHAEGDNAVKNRFTCTHTFYNLMISNHMVSAQMQASKLCWQNISNLCKVGIVISNIKDCFSMLYA